MRIMTTSISSHWFISIVGVVLFGSAQARDGDKDRIRQECPGFESWEKSKPLAASPSEASPRADDNALRLQLLRMASEDQDARNFNPLRGAAQNQRAFKAVADTDRHHLVTLRNIIAKYGVPTIKMVGDDGIRAFWLLTQHADSDVYLQEKVLSDFQRKNGGGAPLDEIALLTDRIRINTGRPQIYGTQFHNEGLALVPNDIERPAEVDELRRKMGLMPLAVYQCALTVTYRDLPVTPQSDKSK
jgi:hypothetical protein